MTLVVSSYQGLWETRQIGKIYIKYLLQVSTKLDQTTVTFIVIRQRPDILFADWPDLNMSAVSE